MLTGHRNEDLAEMLEDVEAGANPEALLLTVVGATIELRESAHLATVAPTDYPDEGDSGAEEAEEEEEEATVMTEERDGMVVEEEDEVVMEEGRMRWWWRGKRMR